MKNNKITSGVKIWELRLVLSKPKVNSWKEAGAVLGFSDFNNFRSSFEEAIYEFNSVKKPKYSRSIQTKKFNQDENYIILEYEVTGGQSKSSISRTIGHFSKILYHGYGWKNISDDGKENRLFDISEIRPI
ncbi:hypothetical protein BHF71_09915 [Vulcanibacillus modesticaldus]|uniref:Uncharacterized protein n=1 Tax=Vulcanibacillus modesticaldus TaxID=337097 RepID=A0A1D2YTJ3_9BACI|nr:hypothetical protein [Vulcanibacillus modesticaldus]OEF98996.1 hypothetical protein BHF71_09915 [Vulcanibacillus modesticaldus]